MPRLKDPKDLTWASTQVPKKLLSEFRAVAKENDRSVAAEIRILMRQHIEEHKNGAKDAA